MSDNDFGSGFVTCPMCGAMVPPGAMMCPNGHQVFGFGPEKSGTSRWVPRIVTALLVLLLIIAGLILIPRLINRTHTQVAEIPPDAYRKPVSDLIDEEPEPPETPTEEEMNDRREAVGAQSGEITLSLFWDTIDDVDLHCITPSGAEIYYSNPRTDGGVLDVDKNVGPPFVTDAVENIYFEEPGHGTYRVFVENYEERTADKDAHVTVRVQIGDKVDTYETVLTVDGQREDIVSIDY